MSRGCWRARPCGRAALGLAVLAAFAAPVRSAAAGASDEPRVPLPAGAGAAPATPARQAGPEAAAAADSATAAPETAGREIAPLRFRVRPGAVIDLGWTGMAHGQPWPAEQRLVFGLRCPAEGGPCALAGGAPGDVFGAPAPLSTGGVPACVVSRLREPPRGSVDAANGCGEIGLRLTSSVFLAQDVARPCPRCEGDAAPNDGRREGRCDAGPRRGEPCDAEGASDLFGATSGDCPPGGGSVGELAIDLALTTGAARREARAACDTRRPGSAAPCLCPGQTQPNACDTGACGPAERCEEGPSDGVCSGAPFRGCLRDGAADCGALHPNAGSCEHRARPCFGEAVAATGHCNPDAPVYVALFCTPATRAAALNATAGLPGLARLVLPLERVP